jgi:ferredoxin
LLKGALANDPNLPPATNPGLSKGPQPVTVEFLGANKKTVTAYLGQSIGDIAKRAGVDIKYSCKKGECRTCEVNFNGKIVKACQSSLPATSRETRFTVGVPMKK